MNEHELYHYGIKGMKWGVRRYQNKDGTLTAKGKKRYYKDEKKVNDEANLAKMHNEARRLAGNQANYLEGVKGKENLVRELDRIYTMNYHSTISDINRYERASKKLIDKYGEMTISELSTKQYKENTEIMERLKKLYGI